jgi:hypothetical protein
MRSSSFSTWLAQLLAGLALFGGGLEIAWIFWANWLNLAVGGLAISTLGLGIVGWAEACRRPRRMLRKAQRSLDLPREWVVEFNRPVADAGVAPIAVTRTDGSCFVIEVKDYKHVAVKKEVTGKDQGALLGPNGKPLDPARLPALTRVASALGATPVLWLPKASANRNLRLQASNLIVVMGTARDLKHVLRGAEVGALRPTPPEPAPPATAQARRKRARAVESQPAVSEPG